MQVAAHGWGLQSAFPLHPVPCHTLYVNAAGCHELSQDGQLVMFAVSIALMARRLRINLLIA